MAFYWKIHRIKSKDESSDTLEICDNGNGAVIQFDDNGQYATGLIVLDSEELELLIDVLMEIKEGQNENS